MARGQNAGVAQPPKSPRVGESQSLQGHQFGEQRRIAELIVQALREAGYSCGLAEDVHAPAFQLKN